MKTIFMYLHRSDRSRHTIRSVAVWNPDRKSIYGTIGGESLPKLHFHCDINNALSISKLKRNTTMPINHDVHCLMCNSIITDEDFQYPLYQEEYPDVVWGPFCESCMATIKICSSCQHPYPASQTTYLGDGEHLCPSCSSHLETCSHCGSKAPEGSFTEVRGKKICKKCLRDSFFLCGICNEYHDKEVMIHKSNLEGHRHPGIFRKYGDVVCYTCYNKKKKHFKEFEVKECRNCGDFYSGPHDKYCPRCLSRFKVCEDCGCQEPNNTKYPVSGRVKVLCDSCKSKYHHCDSCGMLEKENLTVIRGKFGTYSVCNLCKDFKECKVCLSLQRVEEDGICEVCSHTFKYNTCSECGRIRDEHGNCRVCGATEVYPYSFKPRLHFNTTDVLQKGDVIFGWENEVSFGSSSSAKSQNLKRLYKVYDPTVLYAKSDSSIEGSGYEIVSQPMSLEFFQKMDLSSMFSKSMKEGQGCGLHVHVSRSSFMSDVHMYKVINFIHENRKFSEFVAGRRQSGFCERFNKKISGVLKDAKQDRAARHVAVNLNNKNTVEFRIFIGCTKEEELRGRIEWLHALIEFCKTESISGVKDEKRFLSYLMKNKKKYSWANLLVSGYEG